MLRLVEMIGDPGPAPPSLREKIAEIVSSLVATQSLSADEFSLAVDVIEELIEEEKHRV